LRCPGTLGDINRKVVKKKVLKIIGTGQLGQNIVIVALDKLYCLLYSK